MPIHKERDPAWCAPGLEEAKDRVGHSISFSDNTANPQAQALANVKAEAPLHAYIDVAQVWLKRPLSPKRLAWLSDQCDSPLLAPPFKVDETPWWDHRYRQSFRLTQPLEPALRWLAERDDVLLTYAELAFDLSTDEDAKLVLADIFSQHFVQRWHRSRTTKLFDNGNGRTGKRGRVGTSFQWYASKHSKATGEVACFHVEAWVQGSATLRRLGINHPRDLFQFDYAGFIRRQLNGAFFECHPEKLGRYVANKHDRAKRRIARVSQLTPSLVYNWDAAAGHTLLRGLGGIQGVVDTFGRGRYLTSLYTCANPTHSDGIGANNHHSDGIGVSTDTSLYTCANPTHSHRRQLLATYLQSLTNVEFCFPLRPSSPSAPGKKSDQLDNHASDPASSTVTEAGR